jgi:transporter family protein
VPKWLIYSLLTASCFGVWGVLGKSLEHHNPFQNQAFSTLGILPIIFVLATSPSWRVGERRLSGSILAFVSGLLVGVGNIAYYHALSIGGKASTAAALTGLYPLTTVLLGILFLSETPHLVQLTGIAGSLGAIFLMTVNQPAEALSGWVLYAMVPIVLWGGASVVMKLSTRLVSAELATFWFLGAFIPLGLISLVVPSVFQSQEPIGWTLPAQDWLLVTLLGVTYGLGNLSLLAAFRNEGKASIVTPLTALYPIVTIPLAIIIFSEPVGGRTWEWTGIGLALAAGVALSWEPKQRPARTEKMALTGMPDPAERVTP